MVNTICQRSSYPFYIVTYYIKWVTTSWTHSIKKILAYEYKDKSVRKNCRKKAKITFLEI